MDFVVRERAFMAIQRFLTRQYTSSMARIVVLRKLAYLWELHTILRFCTVLPLRTSWMFGLGYCIDGNDILFES